MEVLGINWKPELRKVADLKHWDKNPRKITDAAYQRLKQKIIGEGVHQTLAIDLDNTVLSGNQRLNILLEIGREEVYCMVPDHKLSEQERDKVGIESNINEGMWDTDVLLAKFDVPMLVQQGFTKLDLGIKEVKEDDFNLGKEYEKIKDPISKMGDIYQLGNHRIMCGDSTKESDVKSLVGEETIKMIFTSPPYNMKAGLYGKEYSDDKSREEYIDFNLRIINLWKKNLKGFIFWNISYNKNSRDEFIEIMYKIIKDTSLKFLELIVWNKKHAMPITSKAMLTRQYEDVLLVGDQDTVKADIDLYFAGTSEKNAVFNKRTKKAVTNYWEIGTNNSQQEGHFACFPILLPAKGVEMMTVEREVVADPFIGAGSTMIACEQLERRCFGMEMSPVFVDLAIRRFHRFNPNAEIKCLNREVDMAPFKV